MGKLIHRQADPLGFTPLHLSRIDYHWDKLQGDRLAFDDFTPFSYNDFLDFVFGRYSISYEIGDGVGLATIVMDGCNAWLQLVMYDWSYRDYVCLELVRLAFSAGAAKVTTTVTEDRSNARELMLKHGFVLEGKMRKAFNRWIVDDMGSWEMTRAVDVEIYGLLRGEFYGSSSDDCGSGDRSSRVDRSGSVVV